MMAARLTTLSSSRTLPGQAWASIARTASSVKVRRRAAAPARSGAGRRAPAARRRRCARAAAGSRPRSRPAGSTGPRGSGRRVICAFRSWCVAQTTRTSTAISWRPPTRSIVRSCRKRSSLACSDIGRSPISSSISVPPWAVSILPTVVLVAPVKAPFSWPKSSVSSRFSGIAAQLMATNLPLRLEASCRPCASTSLPVPLSPSSITVASLLATRSIRRQMLHASRRRASSGRPARRAAASACSRRFSACSSHSR